MQWASKQLVPVRNIYNASLVTSRNVLTTSRVLYGFRRNRLPEGRSSALNFARPDVATILMGGHRPLIAAANLRPSIEPGI